MEASNRLISINYTLKVLLPWIIGILLVLLLWIIGILLVLLPWIIGIVNSEKTINVY